MAATRVLSRCYLMHSFSGSSESMHTTPSRHYLLSIRFYLALAKKAVSRVIGRWNGKQRADTAGLASTPASLHLVCGFCIANDMC